MPASKVRTDHDALNQIAQQFARQADVSRQMTSKVKQTLGVLQGGDWVGKGADKFYNEMNGSVLPTLGRLSRSFDSAQNKTLKISQIMKLAEDEAAALFKGGLASGGATGGTAGAGTVEASAGAAGLNAGPVLRIGPGGVPFFPGTGATSAVAGTPTSRMLSGFDPKVAPLVDKSPTLKAQIEQLEKAGWTVKYDTTSTGYYTDHANKVIIIDSTATPEAAVGKIAHEVGHARYGDTTIWPTPAMTRDQFVNGNVDAVMKSEGAAQLNAATVRDEIKTAGGADPGIPGTQTAAYQKVYDDFKAGKITRDQATNQMGTLMGNEAASTSGKKYRDHYIESYRDYWDKNVAPGRAKP